MEKIFTKSLFFLLFFALFTARNTYAQTLTIQNFPSGTYSPGSNIAVPFNIGSGGCIQQSNTFQVYLANSSGTIISGPLSTSTGVYATYLNAVIPAGTAAGTYKFVVKSTSPAVTSAASPSFTVAAGAVVTAAMTSGETLSGNTIGSCNGSNGLTYDFANNSSTASSTASFYDESTQASSGTVTLATSGTFTAAANNYTILVKATNGTTIATQAYTLVNNTVTNAFALSGTNTVCLGSALTYIIDPNTIKNNYPGITYHVDWGDGTSNDYSYCDLVASGGNVTKYYTSGSCANGNKSFTITMQPKAPYCASLTTSITTSATVLQVPINSFTFSPLGCSNTPITFTNTSDPGQDPTTLNCINPNARYTWSVDGTVQLSTVPISTLFTYTFTPGPHTITLHLNSSFTGACPATDVTQSICIQGPPTPAFTLPAGPVCLSSPVTVTDNSVVDASCASSNTYLWTVTGPGSVSFTGGTSSSSHSPQLTFLKAGTYTIKLAITAQNCGTYTTSKTLAVDSPPSITMSANALICGTNLAYNFNTTATTTKTTISGTAVSTGSTYAWTVTGNPAYSFTGGTSASSQYPQITFTGYGTYTVSVTEVNTCGTATKSQNLTFQQVPVVSIDPVSTICPGSSVSLTGHVTPATYNSVQWSGGTGTFSGSTTLTPTYTPSAAEITAGSVTLSLDVKTGLTGTCADVIQTITVNIYPTNNITSPPAETICTGSSVNYGITAKIAGSTFTWTAANTTGTATGFALTGSGSTINDVLVNASPVSNAAVTYTITPTDPHGCVGPAFTLIVTVSPKPIITAVPASALICSGSTGTINLASNIAGTTYTWTSSVTGSITGNTQQASAISTTNISSVLSNSGSTSGTVTYTITPYNGTCAGTPVTASITVDPPAVMSNAGANQVLCNVTSATLNGNNPSPSTGLWTLTSGQTGVTFANAAQNTTTVNGLVPGQIYQFTWTITPAPPCTPNASTVTVTDALPSIGGNTAGAATVCSGSSNGNVTLSGQLGAVIRWESSIDNGTTWQTIANTTTTLTYINITQSTQYRAVVQNGTCTLAYSTATTILVNPPAVTSNAGTNQVLCNAASATLSGNNPSPGTGLWTLTSGQTGVTFTNATQPTTTVNGLVAGQTYQFTWTITPAAPCTPNSSMVTITNDAPSIGGTTAGGTTFCAGTNASGVITLSGQFGAVIRWESSVDNGATWQTIANTATTQSYLNLTQTTEYRAVVQNGSCTLAYSTVSTIVINPVAVTSNAGTNQVLCNAVSATLSGNNPSPGTGLWTITSGQTGVTFTNAAQSTTTVNGLVPGQTYQFTWTITPAAPCTPNSSSVTITDDALSVGGTTAGGTAYCSGSANNGSITLSGQLGAIVRWESSIDNGATWQPIVNTASSQSYLNVTQTTEYRAVVQNGSCTLAYSTASTIVINPAAVTANAGTDQEVCNVTSATLNGNNPSPATGLWTLTSGQTGVTFANATQNITTVNGLVAGQTYQFTWTITPAAPCTPNSSQVTIINDAPSIGGTTTGANAFCAGSNNNGTINLSGQLGAILRWESSIDNGTTWQPIANTSVSQPYTNITQTTQYRAVVQNGVCTFANSAPTIITINQPAVIANAGASQVLCNATSYTLAGNNPSPSSGLWTVTSGQTGVTFSDPTQATATVSGLIPGQTYQFTWTINPAAPCLPNSSSVTITDDAPSVGGTTAGGNTYCAGSNASGAITLSGQTGNVLRWESSINNGTTWQTINNTGTTQQFLNLTQTTQYRAVVQNLSCAFAYSTVSVVTITPPAVQANAGTNQVLCNATTYTLNGNNPSPGTGLWTVTSGQSGITFSNPAQPNATASGLIPGQIYQFTWTVTPALPCAPNSSSVTITDDAPTIGGITAGANTFCAGTNINGTITLSGQLGTVLRWESSIDNGTTWQSIANTTTSLPYLNISQTTQYRAVVQNGICSFANSTVTTITINQPAVAANAGTNQELCNATSYVLQGNSPAPSTGLWTVTSSQTGVTFSDPTQYNATVSGLIPGQTYQFTWTITPSAPCTPNSSTVTIIDDAPTIGGNTAGNTTVCGSNNNGNVTLNGQLGNVLRWESSIDNGITWQPLANTTTTLSYTNLTQTTQFRSVVQNGLCAFAYSTVTTIAVSQPAVIANAGPNQVLCNFTSCVLQGNNPLGGTGLWTVTSGQTGVVFSDPTQSSPTVSGLVPGQVYQFTWTINPAAPCTPNSSTVTITDALPSVGGTTGGANNFCAGSNISGAVTLTGQLGNVLRWESSIDNGTTWQSIANTTTTLQYLNLTQTTQYRAVVQNGVCTFAYSTVTTIIITPPAVTSNAGTNQVLCNAVSYILQGNNPSPGTGMWTVTSSQTGVTFSDPTQPTATVSGLVPGQTYQFTWTITPALPCAPNSSSVTITDNAPSIGGTTAGANTFCAGSNNSGTITLTGQLGAVLRWESSTDNGATWQSVANTSTSQPYLNIAQTTQYRAVVQNGVCSFANSTVTTITINQPAAPANAGTDQHVCNVTSYTLNGNSPLPDAGLWTVASGQTGVVFSNATQASTTVSGLIPGQIYKFTWTITPTAPCAPNSSTVTITDDAPTIGGTTAGATTVCGGNNNGNITLSGQLGNVIRWESSTDNGATWLAIANTTATLSYVNLTQSTQYRAVVQNGICAFAYSTVTIIVVNPPAVIANAGSSQELCNATTYVLQGNNPFPGTGLWTVTSGQTGVTFSDPTQANATASGLVPGQVYQFTWTITPAAPCTPNSSTVTITDDAPTIGGTTAGAATFCSGTNISGTVTLTGQFGAVLRWESSIDNGTTWQSIANTSTSQQYLNLTQTTQYRAVVQNGLCSFANSTPTTITINPPAVQANAGANQQVCNVTSYTLNGNSAFPGAGMWTVTSSQTGVTFSDPTQPNATANGLIPGQTYQFTWTITPGAPCSPNSSSVTIADDAQTIGGTTAGANIFCAGAGNNGTITLSGQTGAVLRWESSTDNGATWQSIANTSTSQPYTNLNQTTQYRAVVQNGTCTFANSTVTTITINPLAAQANAGTDQHLCNVSSYTLNGNSPSPGTGLWTVTSSQTGVTFSDPTQANATANGLIPGQIYKFTWTITPAAPCAPNSSTVTITDDAPTIGGTTAGATTVCGGNNNGNITLSGQLGNVIRWESSTDNGVTWLAIANTTATLPYANLGQTTQFRAAVQNGVCTFAYSTITIVVVNPPAVLANAGTDQRVCNATTYILQGNNPLPGTGLWTVTSGQTGIIFSDSTQPNASVSGMIAGQTYQFTWTITPLAPCTPNSSSVTITDDAPSVGGTTAGANSFCAGSNISGTITLTGELGNILRWESSTDNGSTWQSIANTSTSQQYLNLTQTTQYRAIVQNGTCTFAYSTISAIVINPPAVASAAGPNQELCNATSYILQGNNPSPNTGLWTLASGQTGVTFSDPTQPNATVSGLMPGQTYQFTWTITPGLPCMPNSSSVTITNDAPTVGGTTAGSTVYCAGNNISGVISLNGELGNILRWESSVDNGTTWQSITNTTSAQSYLNLSQTTQYRAVVQNGVCTFAYSTVSVITINPPAVVAYAGPDQEVCNVTSLRLAGNNPLPGSGLWTLTSNQTGVVFSDPTQNNATVSGLIPGQTYQFTWTVSSGAPCAPNSSLVTITDDTPTDPGTTTGSNTYCAGTPNSGAIILAGQVGAILRWESSTDNGTTWQPIVNTTPTQQYINLLQTTQYRAVVQSGVCNFAYSTVSTIVINAPAVQANAGANQELCNASFYILHGNDPSPGTGLWTVTSGQTGIVFSDPTKANATVTGMIPGDTYQFTWTVTPGAPCTPNSSTVTITDDKPTVGGTTSSDAIVCAGGNGATITLTGQVGNVLRWETSTDNGASWQAIVNTSATQQYVNLIQTTQYRAVVQNGVCNFDYSTVTTITVNQPVQLANAGGNQQLCGATSFTLQGNNPAPFAGVWTQTSGPATTIASPNNYQTQVTGLVPGNTYTFLWTIKGQAPCPDSSDPVQIHDLNDVVASFAADKTDGCGPYTVNFTNTSTSLTGVSFLWDFGDGSPTSTAVNPSHNFVPRTDGRDTTYTVSLNIVNNCTQRAPYTVNVTIRPDVPVAYILPQQLIGCSPFTLAVNNYSPGNNKSYTYYLYDGSVLVQQIVTTNKNQVRFNPINATTTKTYSLYMVATGFCGNTGQSKIIPITISVSTIVAQMYLENNINKGCAPFTANFVNNSIGADTYYYTIYDVNHVVIDRRQGSITAMPYTFNTPGTYYVTITAMNSCATAESNPPIRIDVYPPPSPAFTADLTSGCRNILVNFTNTTPNDANTQAASMFYDWDFGDGSPHDNGFTPPPHSYSSKNSPFTVTLTATNSATGCTSSTSKINYIIITPPPGAEFTEKPDSVTVIPNYGFSFIDKTSGIPKYWHWNFGDGQVSTVQNPYHTYQDTGLYKVTLTTISKLGCDSTISHNVRITGTPGQVFVPNAFQPDGASIELRTFMAKGSGMKEWHMQIFNNYAQCIWETRKLDDKGAPVDGWDGTYKGSPMPQGVYVWQITARFINGTDWKGNVIKKSTPSVTGVIHLIR